jgi:transcriptional regulator with XRE-family HTH domain
MKHLGDGNCPMKAQVKGKVARFNVGIFHAALDSHRVARNLTWRGVSAESGVCASTLTRISQGKRPDVDSLAALTGWVGVSSDRFMGLQGKTALRAGSPLAQISSIIRTDPNLNPEAAIALDELVKATYARLRGKKKK